ncbi:hypothetical protein [Legionella sainthelensi]|uniref:hypothetical protein n=1 Tax=Legionella sainthelensi TaxID=28087 RepID=UPI000E1FCF20|nr:hypothetical protein [Legionella sainthelensi]
MNNMSDVTNLLSSLEPEFNDFHNLIKDMALVDSSYKKEFTYMKVLVNKGKSTPNFTRKINLLINELNHFGEVLDKIAEDDEARESYVKVGLLDKSVALQKRILSKFS